MRKVLLGLLLCFGMVIFSKSVVWCACNPIGEEIADNNIDEDCDGWLATSWGYNLRAGHPRTLVTSEELEEAIDRMYGENAREPYKSWFDRIKSREDTADNPSLIDLALIYKATGDSQYLDKYHQALYDYLMPRSPGLRSGPSLECFVSMDIMWDEISSELKLKALELGSALNAFYWHSGENPEYQNFYYHGATGRGEALSMASIFAFDPILESEEVRNNPGRYSFNCPLYIKTIKEELYPGGTFWDTERRIAGDMRYNTALPGSYGGMYDNFGYDHNEDSDTIILTTVFSNATGENRIAGELHDQYRGLFWQNMSVPHRMRSEGSGENYCEYTSCARIWNTQTVDFISPAKEKVALTAYKYQDPYMQHYANLWRKLYALYNYDYYTTQLWYMLLFYDDSLEEYNFDRNPTAMYFSGPGLVTMRSDWSKDATFAVFVAGEGISRRYEDANSFIIHRKTDLMVHAGARIRFDYDNNKHHWYHIRSISKNTLKIFDPDECFDIDSDGHRTELHQGTPLVQSDNMGGQIFELRISSENEAYGGGEIRPRCSDCHPNGECWNTADIIKYEHRPGEYTYAVGDGEPAYTKKIEYYLREFVYLRPSTFVIFDKVKSVNPNYKKVWIAHTVDEPVVNADEDEENNGMKAYNNARQAEMDSRVNMTYYHFLMPNQNKVVIRGGDTILVSSSINPSNPITEGEIIKQPDIARWLEVFAVGGNTEGTITIRGDAEEGDNVTEDIVFDGNYQQYTSFYHPQLSSTNLYDENANWRENEWSGYLLHFRGGSNADVLITGNDKTHLYFNSADVSGVWGARIIRYMANTYYHWKHITSITTSDMQVDNLILSTPHYFDAVDAQGKLYSFAPHTDGRDDMYRKRRDYGQWTLELEASQAQLHDNFLNVIYLTDPGDGDITTQLIEGDEIAGVLLNKDRVVVFKKEPGVMKEVSYSIVANGEVKNMVVDLDPLKEYELYVDGEYRGTLNSSSQGIVYFSVQANENTSISLSATGGSASQSRDVNQDGSVNVSDVQLVVNVILGNATNDRADVNGDERVTISDVQEVVNEVIGGS